MGVILIPPGGGGGGGGASDHSHANLASLNALRTNGDELYVNGKAVGERAVEMLHDVTLTALDISNKYIELPEDCDAGRALSVSLQGLTQRRVGDWDVDERDAPSKDRVMWAALGMERVAQAGDEVTITYYRKV